MQKPPPPPVDLSHLVRRRADLVDAGLTDRHVAQLVRAGALARVRRGAYADGEVWRSLDDADKHRVRTRAVLLTAQPGTVATHVSSAVEHGAPIWDIPLALVHTTRSDGVAGRRRNDWVQHRGALPEDHVELRNGIPVSKAARACVEIAMITDLERTLVVVNALLHQRATTKAELEDVIARTDRWPHTVSAQLLLLRCSDQLESVGETRFDHFCWHQHLPRPVPQVEVYDESGALVGRVDFLWPDHGVWVEFDGKEKYLRFRRPGETLDEFLMREKKREEKIAQLTGWTCIRVTWADLANPRVLAGRIRQLLESRRRVTV